MIVRLARTDFVKARLGRFKELGMEVVTDFKAGTAEVTMEGEKVFTALQLGRGGGWVCTYHDNPFVKWMNRDDQTKGGGDDGEVPDHGDGVSV